MMEQGGKSGQGELCSSHSYSKNAVDWATPVAVCVVTDGGNEDSPLTGEMVKPGLGEL